MFGYVCFLLLLVTLYQLFQHYFFAVNGVQSFYLGVESAAVYVVINPVCSIITLVKTYAISCLLLLNMKYKTKKITYFVFYNG